jgi:hypothetical protein
LDNYNSSIINRNTFRVILLWFITLTSIKLYTLFIPYGAGKLVILFGAVIVIFILILHIIYSRVKRIPMKFSIEVWIFILSFTVAPLAALVFHQQPILSSILAQHGTFFIFLYFLLHHLKPHPQDLMKMFVALGFVYCGVYLIQFFAFPTILVSSMVFADRGTIRIFLPGSEYLFTGYFILLGRYFIYKQTRFLLYIIPFLIILLLMGTRQMIASLVFASLVNVLLSKTIKSKVLMYFVLALCMIPLYFVFQDIFMKMFEVSGEQSDAGLKENVRFKATIFYLLNFNPSNLWVLTGNGMPDALTAYGRNISSIAKYSGFYLEDIGLFGDMFRFGVLFVIAKVVIYIRLTTKKMLEKYTFIRYCNITILLTLFTGGGLNASILALTCFMMYIIDYNDYEIFILKKSSNPEGQTTQALTQ